MEILFYVILNAFCAVLLAILGYNSKRHLSSLVDDRLFNEVILSTIILVVSDIIWRLVDGVQIPAFRIINIVTSGAVLAMTGVICCIWASYVDYKIGLGKNKYKSRILLYLIPTFVLAILVIISPWTKMIYYVDANNNYHRGKLYIIQVMICYSYLVATTIISLFVTRGIKLKRRKSEIHILAVFAVFPVFSGFVQVLNSDLPLTCVGITISILLIYINIQNKQISRDALTGINNRLQLNRYLDIKLSEKKHERYLFFILIDVDKFKYINDTFGHLEGDNALITVTEILTNVCDNRSDFLARFGGDEFAIVCERKNVTDVEKLKGDIYNAIEAENINSEALYKLSLSMGSAQFFTDGHDTQDEVIALADRRLYLDKNKKRLQRI